MNLVDANLLLYAVIRDYPQHTAARSWLEGQLNGSVRVGLPWVSLMAFLRVSTNRRVFSRPLAPGVAWSYVDEWLSLPTVWVPNPTERHAEVLAGLIEEVRPTAGLLTDTHLAALALEHGLTMCSTDGDFARFRALRWVDPIA